MTNFIAKLKELLSYAAPLSGAQFIGFLSMFVPMIFVARLGEQQLAASALATSTVIIFNLTMMSAMRALSVLISYEHERGKYKEIGSLLWHGLLLGVAVSLVLAAVLWFAGYFLLLFGQNPVLVDMIRPYLHVSSVTLVILSAFLLMRQFYVGIGRPRITLYLAVFSTLLCVFLSAGFVLGYFDFPKIGLVGLAWAFLISQSLALIVMVILFFHCGYHHEYGVFNQVIKFSPKVSKNIARLAVPISMQTTAEIIALSVITYFMGWFGQDGLAAVQIVNQYIILFVVIYAGFSQAVSVLVSRAMAKGNMEYVKEYVQVALIVITLIMIVVGLIFVLMSDNLVLLFLGKKAKDAHEILSLAHYFFIIAIVANYADSVRFILSGAYQGMKEAKKPMIVGIFSLWVIGVGVAYFLAVSLGYGPVGLRIGIAFGFVCAAVYLSYDFFVNKLSCINK